MSISLNIFGGCIARDIFGFCDSKEIYRVKMYTFCINPVSLMLRKSPIKIDKIDLLRNAEIWGNMPRFYVRNHVMPDLLKDMERVFLPADYFLCYFPGLATDLLESSSQSLTGITYQNYLDRNYGYVKRLQSVGILDNNIKMRRRTEIPQKEIYQGIDKFLEKATHTYSPSQIIFLDVNFAHYYSDFEGSFLGRFDSKDVQVMEDFYREGINYAKKCVPGCHVIPSLDNVIADIGHKWGLSPEHFLMEYYEYAYRAMNIIVLNKDHGEETYELESLKKIYDEKFFKYISKPKKNFVKSFDEIIDRNKELFEDKRSELIFSDNATNPTLSFPDTMDRMEFKYHTKIEMTKLLDKLKKTKIDTFVFGGGDRLQTGHK